MIRWSAFGTILIVGAVASWWMVGAPVTAGMRMSWTVGAVTSTSTSIASPSGTPPMTYDGSITNPATLGVTVLRPGVGVTVVGVARAASLLYARIHPGNIYLVFDIDVKDVSTTGKVAQYNSGEFSIVDRDSGYSYSVTFAGDRPCLCLGNLAPGEHARGVVIFEVPVTAQRVRLSYQPGGDVEPMYWYVSVNEQ